MADESKNRSFADRRAEDDAPMDDEADFADERTPSKTDPPNAEADAPGGTEGRYDPPTRT